MITFRTEAGRKVTVKAKAPFCWIVEVAGHPILGRSYGNGRAAVRYARRTARTLTY